MIDWTDWIKRWDRQQERYIPTREERFQLMFDIIETKIGSEFNALDLGCGPGSLSDRLTNRFPEAKVYAFDVDPLLLKIANHGIGDKNGSIEFIEADLRSDIWDEHIDDIEIDAVLSTTALHWLPPTDLLQLYLKLGNILRKDGIFLNAEGISFPRPYTGFTDIIDGVKEIRNNRRSSDHEGEEWDEFWDNLKTEFKKNGMEELVEERERRFHWRDHTEHRSPSYELQKSALEDIGFSEVGIIWQDLKNRILLAIH